MNSDHCCLKFDLNCYAHYSNTTEKSMNYSKANYRAIRNKLRMVNWDETLNGSFMDDYTKFLDKIELATSGNIPEQTSQKKKNNLYMTSAALRLKNRKQRLWKRYTKTKDLYDHSTFTKAKNELRTLTRQLRTAFEKRLAAESKDKPKQFWKYVHSKLKTRARIPTLNNPNGTFSVSNKEKAESLNSFFSSIFVDEDLANMPEITYSFTGDSLHTLHVTEEFVLSKLNNLDPGKSPGPENWHPYFLKELSKELSHPLSILYNKSIKEGVLPSQWLEASITAIHKKGAKSNVGNYRPVSLTSVICKIIESIIRDSILEYMVRNNLFTNDQHGFVPSRDCMTNLLLTIGTLTSIIEDGGPVDIIYTDFAKAFDSVPHKRLLSKVNALGIKGDILQWINSFLSNRRQRGVVEGKSSSWENVKSGIPQGTVLGPILFVIFVNDLTDDLTSMTKLFADDTKVYREVNNREDASYKRTWKL